MTLDNEARFWDDRASFRKVFMSQKPVFTKAFSPRGVSHPMFQGMALPVWSSDRFTWDSNTRTFSCEISDFDEELTGSVYRDQIDPGFGIRSVKTQNVVYFILRGAESNEGETTVWWYQALPGQNQDDLFCMVVND